ncbi:MAG: 30S ribosomal protein S4 [Nanoarchaeota archaeon]|nr:30S ribosomal protein S4 [Nanoarchaeota archaeon]
MRKITPKFEKPLKPWDRTRLESEREILSAYGLRRKQEIWKVESILRVFRKTARELEAKKDKAKEEMFLNRIRKLGLVSNSAVLDDVLALEAGGILDRRLQTIVFRKGLASTLKQARQYITHGHITVGGRRSTWPSLIVDAEKEKTVAFHEKSEMKARAKTEAKEIKAENPAAEKINRKRQNQNGG